jgi:hypothetical protein
MQSASANNLTNKPIRDVKEKWKKKVEAAVLHQADLLHAVVLPAKLPHRKVQHLRVVLLREEVHPAEAVLHRAEVHQVVHHVLHQEAVLQRLLQAAVVHHPAVAEVLHQEEHLHLAEEDHHLQDVAVQEANKLQQTGIVTDLFKRSDAVVPFLFE